MADEKKLRVLKIQVGTVYLDGKSHGVFQDAWEKKSKDGKTYFEIRTPVFVSSVQKKEATVKPKENLDNF